MIILSYNARGLGYQAKRRVVRELICKEKVEFACFQETKLEAINTRLCLSLWGDSEFG